MLPMRDRFVEGLIVEGNDAEGVGGQFCRQVIGMRLPFALGLFGTAVGEDADPHRLGQLPGRLHDAGKQAQAEQTSDAQSGEFIPNHDHYSGDEAFIITQAGGRRSAPRGHRPAMCGFCRIACR